MDLTALWQGLISFLERLLIGFLAYLKARDDVEQEMNTKGSQKLIDTYKEILKVEDETKKLSDKDLASNTVDDS